MLTQGSGIAQAVLQFREIRIRGLVEAIEGRNALLQVTRERSGIRCRARTGRSAAVESVVERGEAKCIQVIAEYIHLAVDVVCLCRGCLNLGSPVPECKSVGNLFVRVAEGGKLSARKILEAALRVLRGRADFGIGAVINAARIRVGRKAAADPNAIRAAVAGIDRL